MRCYFGMIYSLFEAHIAQVTHFRALLVGLHDSYIDLNHVISLTKYDKN